MRHNAYGGVARGEFSLEQLEIGRSARDQVQQMNTFGSKLPRYGLTNPLRGARYDRSLPLEAQHKPWEKRRMMVTDVAIGLASAVVCASSDAALVDWRQGCCAREKTAEDTRQPSAAAAAPLGHC